ncbi:phosphate ABC transporter permease subunit PstC [Sulfurimonas sp. SWIR-19]|uniref:phosphate ABC transporter permease subunit PstC n=1 Tax=Sulfurimonas sp. SWIR-19 TaxID=2878390 RepID=UPI001CF5622D|nr:phosphate ABC transporter permease subunit PstC [Sulfurimonas sp. SWIR-19]UCM99955.1 phosphate ABC transporter permease subunit PstC [Sulfurimonas sp. SWIR-19]
MEKIFQKLSLSSASLVLVILIGIFITLFSAAKPAIEEFGLHFLVDPTWNKEVPVEGAADTINTALNNADENAIEDEDDMILNEDEESQTKTLYGGLVPIVGTILSTLIALSFALPIAMGIAVFLAEIASKNISKFVGMAIELLAAIPSIIFGMWGLYYFAPIISDTFGGYQVSLLTAGLVLGIMILPFMAAITRDSMNTTPDVLKESAYALGATKFEVVKDIIFPYSKVGIIGSIILALGRALGETMAVAFLIGAVYSLPEKITDPTISIPVAMAVNFGEASGLGESALFYLGLILFVMSFIIISVAKFYFLKKVKL